MGRGLSVVNSKNADSIISSAVDVAAKTKSALGHVWSVVTKDMYETGIKFADWFSKHQSFIAGILFAIGGIFAALAVYPIGVFALISQEPVMFSIIKGMVTTAVITELVGAYLWFNALPMPGAQPQKIS